MAVERFREANAANEKTSRALPTRDGGSQ